MQPLHLPAVVDARRHEDTGAQLCLVEQLDPARAEEVEAIAGEPYRRVGRGSTRIHLGGVSGIRNVGEKFVGRADS